jgi:hypothetical protein
LDKCKIIIHILIQQRDYFNPVGRESDRRNSTMSQKYSYHVFTKSGITRFQPKTAIPAFWVGLPF